MVGDEGSMSDLKTIYSGQKEISNNYLGFNKRDFMLTTVHVDSTVYARKTES